MATGPGNGARALIRGLRRLPGELYSGLPLARLTTFRIGGPAWAVFAPSTPAALVEAVVLARALGVPWKLLGRGSNVLFPDAGFPGLILSTTRLNRLQRQDGLWIAEAGVPLGALAPRGFSALAGIPGTLGGGLAMNAGTRVGELGAQVAWVEVLLPDGEVARFSRSECGFSYRDSRLRRLGLPVLRAGLMPRAGPPLAEALARRAGQPSLPSAGCVFRNPQVAPAGWLIERAGLKGAREGEAMVSRRHANFIVNLGRATARDVLSLVDRIRDRVAGIFDVWLELELEIVSP
ncbi:TPA: FAD-binding protein [Candidatus Bipolaricaulota bacterium]|nr:FAD-binding protein [Candidatus Bipolaricaulota bacterium]